MKPREPRRFDAHFNFSGRCAAFCIVPPYLLEHLLSKAKTAEHRRKLLDSINLSSHVRGARTVALARKQTHGTAQISVYDARHRETSSGAALLWSEAKGGTPTDPDVKNVVEFTRATRDFYREVFKRNSVDGKGYDLRSYIHFGDGWDNAQWDGTQMDYGDGDGVEFNSFTSSVDVIGHELTHGVTQYTSDLEYQAQSGALNESFSDVMGTMIKQYHLKQNVAGADWLIGQGLFKNGDALRSMKQPGTAYDGDPQPADMSHYKKTTQDSGGVHLNSGIPNRAFYEACNAFGPQKNAWETIGPVWYQTFIHLPADADFQTAADATFTRAKLLGTAQAQAVQAGWAAVKIDVKVTMEAIAVT